MADVENYRATVHVTYCRLHGPNSETVPNFGGQCPEKKEKTHTLFMDIS